MYDVGCICYLADLTIKAGMGTLPLDLDELFVDIFYFFHHSCKRKQCLLVCVASFLQLSQLFVHISTQKCFYSLHYTTLNLIILKCSTVT